MKKNFAMKLAVLTLIVTMITASLVSGTYSKYVTTVTASDSARVAKFAFKLGAYDSTQSQAASFNIFNYADDGVYKNDGTKTKGIIAPGTKGSLDFSIENDSEVAVIPTIVFTETNSKNIPIYYTISDTDGAQRYTNNSDLIGKKWDSSSTLTYGSLSDLATALGSDVRLDATNGSGAKKENTIFWKWDIGTSDSDNASDTTLGKGYDETDEHGNTVHKYAAVTLQIATTVTQSNG